MKIVIIGGRGNGTVIASTIEDCKAAGQDVECAGFLNDEEIEIVGYPVLGRITRESWKGLGDCHFIYALSNVKQACERHQLLKELQIPDEKFPAIVHPTAVVSSHVKLGHGVVLMPNVVISPNVIIGSHSQMYAQSFVGHDTILGEMVFVANNASIGGRVCVQDGVHVGSNASIVERIILGKYALIGLGAVVIHEVAAFDKVAGNPARVMAH